MAAPQGMVATSVAGGSPVTFVSNGVEFLRLTESTQDEFVVNEDGADIDTRIEASGAANALFVRGSDGNVGVGTNAPAETFHSTANVLFGSAGALYSGFDTVSAVMGFNTRKVSGTYTAGKTAAAALIEDNNGGLNFYTAASVGAGSAQTLVERLSFDQTEFVFNDPGNVFDVRAESDTLTHAMFLDAVNDAFHVLGRGSTAESMRVKRATSSLDLSVSTTATNLIPDGAFILGVLSRIKTNVVFDSTHTTWEVGDGSDTNLWGASTTLTAGTALGANDFTAAGAVGTFYTAANNVVITPTGGAGGFSSGVIELVVVYIDLVDMAADLP